MHQNIIDKINNLELIDTKDFLDIAYRHCKKNGSLKILDDVIFDSSVDYIGAYHPICKQLIFSFPLVQNLVNKAVNRQDGICHITNEEKIYLSNFYYLYTLFHELRHIKQYYNHDYNSLQTNGIILYLYELCEKLQITNKTLYEKNHDLFPIEMDANYHGFIDSYNLLSKTNASNKVKNIMLHTTLLSPIINYSKGVKLDIKSPIEKLEALDERFNLDLIRKMIGENNLSFEDKISHGMKINYLDYHNRCLQIEKVRKLIKR